MLRPMDFLRTLHVSLTLWTPPSYYVTDLDAPRGKGEKLMAEALGGGSFLDRRAFVVFLILILLLLSD